MPHDKAQENAIRIYYEQYLPRLREAKKRIDVIIKAVLSRVENRDLVRVRVQPTRIKELDSIRRKAFRKGITIEEAMQSFGDLVGARVVCNNVEDIYRFYELIREILPADDVVNVDDFIKSKQASGYRAIHLNVRFRTREGLSPDYVQCELQIRTLLQDAWAELAHDDVYKSGTTLPPDLVARTEDLSELLALADGIAGKIRQRIQNDFSREGTPSLIDVSNEGLALVFARCFGRPPTDYGLRVALRACEEQQLDSLTEVETFLSQPTFRDELRKIYHQETGFGFDPSPEQILELAVLAAGRDEDTAFKKMASRARKEKREVEASWLYSTIAEFPSSVDKFLEQAEQNSLWVEEAADALGVISTCSVCNVPIVEPEAFAQALADHYELDEYTGIFKSLQKMAGPWTHEGHIDLCDYHGHVFDKDE